MTASTTTPHRQNGQRPRLRAPSASSQAPSRNRGRIAAGATLLAVSAVLGALLYGNLGNRTAVLVVARDVAPGKVVEDRDVKVVNVAADAGVTTMPASQRASVVGRRATARLLAGSLVAPASVGDGPSVPSGSTVIGAVVKPGQYPVGLREGDEVIVLIASDGGENGEGVNAVITSVSSNARAEGTAIALAVPSSGAAALARAGAAGRLILMQAVR
jgi:hypothetical protein